MKRAFLRGYLSGLQESEHVGRRSREGFGRNLVAIEPLELIAAFHDAKVELDYDSVLWAIEGASHNAPASPTLPAGEAALDVIEELIAVSGSGIVGG